MSRLCLVQIISFIERQNCALLYMQERTRKIIELQ